MRIKPPRPWLIASLALAALVGSVAGFAVVPESATAAPNSLRMNPASPVIPPAGSVTLGLVAEAPAALLGAWDLRVSFDDSVIQVTNSVTPCTGQSNCNLISHGVLGVNGFNASGLSGTQTLASIQFTAVGSAGQSSDVGIQVIAFTDPNGDGTNPTITSGLVTIQATTAPTPALVIPTQQATRPPTLSPSPTPTSSPSPTPQPTVLPAARTPASSPTAAPAIVVASSDSDRPSVVRSVPTLGDITLSAGVTSTNFLLALFTLIVLLLTAAIFNQTLKENEHRIHSIVAGLATPFAALLGAVSTVAGTRKTSRALLSTFIGLAVIAAVYGLEEPGAGLNNRSLVLFLSYFGAFAIATMAFEGSQLVMSRSYGVPAVVRVFPIGVGVALAAVTITRVTGFQPGLMYGFVAAHSFISPTNLTREQQGKQTLYPALALLGACLLAWILAEPLRTLAEDNNDWWAAVPEGIAVGLFVSGLEGLFFQLIPIEFMDGRKLFAWNKPAWLAISLASGFLFWEVLINNDQQSLDAISSERTIVSLIVVLSCLAATIGLWLFFKALGPQEAAEATSS